VKYKLIHRLNLLISSDHYHRDTYGQDVLPRPRVCTDHHHGDTYGHNVLPRPRVYRGHHHGDAYGQDVIAKAKGIYKSSSWRHVQVKMYC